MVTLNISISMSDWDSDNDSIKSIGRCYYGGCTGRTCGKFATAVDRVSNNEAEAAMKVGIKNMSFVSIIALFDQKT
eukprot:4794075-Ditylum_brightwellii.AAC.1